MKNILISISPINIVRRIIYMIREFYLFIFYIRKLKTIESELDSNKIFKYSWFSYVKAINLKAETLSLVNKPYEELEEDQKKELEKLELSFISREISKHNDIFIKADIIELIKTKAVRVKDSDFYGYMVEISFNWKNASLYHFLRTFFHMIIWTLIILMLPYNFIYEYVISFFNK